LIRGGTAALPRKGATTSSPVTREPAIIQAARVRSIEIDIGIGIDIAIDIWNTITSTGS